MKRYVLLTLVIVAAIFVAVLAASAASQNKGDGNGIVMVYQDNCARCHGKTGKGRPNFTPDFTKTEWQSSKDDNEIIKVINNGEGTMPSYKKSLKPVQIKALVRHIRGFSSK